MPADDLYQPQGYGYLGMKEAPADDNGLTAEVMIIPATGIRLFRDEGGTGG